MRQKEIRFKAIVERNNIIEPLKENYGKLKGIWREQFFKNDNDIVLELACGKGEYTVGLSRRFPNKNYIGVDVKGDRIWVGSLIAEEEKLTNAAFLRTQIELIENHFAENEVDEIWIVFPDPRPRESDAKRRLTSPRFLELYKKICKPGSIIHLKTDNTPLFFYTLEVLQGRPDIKNLEFTTDLYHSPLNDHHYGIRTKFEAKFNEQGHDIKYLKFQLF